MFDAAIECLREHISIKLEYKLNLEELPSFESAIRVLEAAAKVSERDLGRVFMGFVSAELRELLEAIKSANAALPDAPKEGKK